MGTTSPQLQPWSQIAAREVRGNAFAEDTPRGTTGNAKSTAERTDRSGALHPQVPAKTTRRASLASNLAIGPEAPHPDGTLCLQGASCGTDAHPKPQGLARSQANPEMREGRASPRWKTSRPPAVKNTKETWSTGRPLAERHHRKKNPTAAKTFQARAGEARTKPSARGSNIHPGGGMPTPRSRQTGSQEGGGHRERLPLFLSRAGWLS